MWGKTAAASSPASWAGFSDASAAEGSAEKDDLPPSDALVWAPLKTPFRSPHRMEEEFEAWFSNEELPRSPPTPSASFPAVFMEPASSAGPHADPTTTRRLSDPPMRPYRSSASSFEAYSYSSDEGAPRDHSTRRDTSRRRRSRSRSSSRPRHVDRRSRSPRRKFRRSLSPEEEWVRVSIPRSQLLGAAAVADTLGWLPRPRSPVGFIDWSRFDRQRSSSHQTSRDRHGSAKVPTPPAQRGESPPRSGSHVTPSRSPRRRPERERFVSSTGKPADPWFSRRREKSRTETSAPAAMPVLRPVARELDHSKRMPPPGTAPFVGGPP
ncbi:serine/arginine repetitive matrix protein 1-like [Palaemon carinicauda]|uniref:serine/arginine repetitive matrix protein 1-like n=1 Tax=Palaemon carinicauda TaxID=392227 RepID=UPI0035B5FEF8